jgi:hypothetical protein
VASDGADHVGADRIASDGTDHVGVDRVASAAHERGLAATQSEKSSHPAPGTWDRMKARELAGELCYTCLTK